MKYIETKNGSICPNCYHPAPERQCDCLAPPSSPFSHEVSKHPHSKLPSHLKDQIIPDVIWLIYRGSLLLGWQSDDPSKENTTDQSPQSEFQTQ